LILLFMQAPFALRFWIIVALFAALTLIAYWPGLHGGFSFDDLGTLPALGAFGPVTHADVFWHYITSGGGDPTGRPLAMLSFLLDARDWPADPAPFKRTNLLLHVVNGVLLIVLLRRLGRESLRDAPAARVDVAAALAGAYWMLQPLLVSTTLYVVQRETMLCASFVLLGLIAWLQGRRMLLGGKHYPGLLCITVGLAGGTLLATLSKANGILLPAFALIIEYGFLRAFTPPSSPAGRSYTQVMLVLAVLPAAVVCAYLIYQGWLGFVHGVPPVRPWTLGQRLLTEPRVLMSYLRQWWLPQPFTTGLFNDQIRASTSLWSPITTLPSILAVLALILGGWRLRRVAPTAALAILFYFTGQLLESSTIPLELYFEHRNYLPAMMMYWPLCLWLCDIRVVGTQTLSIHAGTAGKSSVRRMMKPALSLVLLLGLALMTHAAATLWGNSRDQALFWAALNPNSPRAQTNAAIVEMRNGQLDRAVTRLRTTLEVAPSEAQVALNLFTAECALGRVDPTTITASHTALRTMRDAGPLLLNWFDEQLAQLKSPRCPEQNTQTLHDLLNSALANPNLTSIYGRRQDLYHIEGQLALSEGNANLALRYFNQALDQQVIPNVALNQAALLGEAGFPAQGLAHLDYFDRNHQAIARPDFGMPYIHAWLLQREQYWPKELAQLRATLSEGASHRSESPDDPASRHF
jgi:protein O-mannosyl-transferase